MTARSVALAIGAGFATFLVVGVVVTEVAGHWIAFSLFIGLPAGAIAGALATAAVTAGLTGDVPDRHRRVVGGFAGFVVGFVVGIAASARLLSSGMTLSIVVGAVVGLIAAAWGSRQGEPLAAESQS